MDVDFEVSATDRRDTPKLDPNREVSLQVFDPDRHDTLDVAELIFEADVELNTLAFGDRRDAVVKIARMTRWRNNFYDPRHVRRIVVDDVLGGVVVGFYASQAEAVQRTSWLHVVKAFGVAESLRRLTVWWRLGRIVMARVPEDTFYVHSLAVAPGFRGRGIGSHIVEQLVRRHGHLVLDVNIRNEAARSFYRRNGFEVVAEQRVRIGDRERGTLTMQRVR